MDYVIAYMVVTITIQIIVLGMIGYVVYRYFKTQRKEENECPICGNGKGSLCEDCIDEQTQFAIDEEFI